jgi:formate dehydrogenase subunit gamma
MKTKALATGQAGRKRSAPKTRPIALRRAVTRREAAEAANRLRTTPEGNRYVLRFSASQRIEHLVLLFAFTGLAITGLAQTFYTSPLANLILTVFGGIDNDRAMHHIFAFIFLVLGFYHVGHFVYQRFVNRRTSKMFPEWSDFEQLLQMIKFNLGVSQRFPRFDRYNFEEKAEYWALIWGGCVMGITGLMQWFPVLVTDILPGWAIPVARAFHKWEAILAVLAILTWHFYHVVLKELNLSIFTGNMSAKEMEEGHPLELAYLEQAAAALGSKTWPVIVQIPREIPEAAEPAAAAPEPVEGAAAEPAATAVAETQQLGVQDGDQQPVVQDGDQRPLEGAGVPAEGPVPVVESETAS